ncbi:acylphosphatase [bacterium]|nr:acylphosphatase [bacterium]
MPSLPEALPGAELHSWRVRVSGRVQGVYFRAWTQDTARRLGIRGWVRNEPDGSVLALLQHELQAQLAEMERQMRSGPPAAAVLNLEREELADCSERCSGFEVRR